MPESARLIADQTILANSDAIIVSVTRFRARSVWVLPQFAFHAHRAIAQLRGAHDDVAVAMRQDTDMTFWTMTLWRNQTALQNYVMSGAHGGFMKHLRAWGKEAAVVRWAQNGLNLPEWTIAERRLGSEGRASSLRHPGPAHDDLSYAARPLRYAGRL